MLILQKIDKHFFQHNEGKRNKEEQRRNANNAHLARYRLSGEEVYPLYDPAGNKLSYGSMGHDGMGGVFDPEGYSS